MKKREDPSQKVTRARRLQTVLDKMDYLAKGHSLLVNDEWRYLPWTLSNLPDELGWSTISNSIYWDEKNVVADRWYLRPEFQEQTDESEDSDESEASDDSEESEESEDEDA